MRCASDIPLITAEKSEHMSSEPPLCKTERLSTLDKGAACSVAPAYIFAAHHSRPPLHAPYTMSGSPQAETGTSDHRQGRRRRHRRRHDGAVAYLAQPPAAFPRCRDLPDSSLADRAGQEPSRCRRREGRGLSAGPGPFMLGLLATPLPPSPSPPLPLPPPNLPNFTPSHPPPSSQNLHTHLQTHHTPDTPSHTHTLTHASLSCLTTRGSSLYARSGFPASHIEPRPVPTP